MRVREKVLIISAVVLLVILCMILLPRGDDEPRYKGRSLQYWLLAAEQPNDLEEATEALTQIGTNSLPFLLEWIQHEQSPGRMRALAMIPPAFEEIAHPFAVTHRDLLASASAEGFHYVGTNAVLAIPELQTFVWTTNAPQTAFNSMRALTQIGTNGLPPLIAAAKDPQYPLRVYAVAAIAFCPNASGAKEITMPLLIALLSDTTNPHIAPLAAIGLGRITNAPESTIPALMNAFTSPAAPERVRIAAAQSLGELGTQAVGALPALTNALTDTSFTIRIAATNAISQMHQLMTTRAQ